MAKEIFITQQMANFLRDSGYKSIDSAISEIVDNSVEAKATSIFILMTESIDSRTGRKYVSEIAFLDNGCGMDDELLESCLGMGYTTRFNRRGMGRFGVGLPQSSLYACPTVDVYSWQNGYKNCKKVYLDTHKVKAGTQTEIEEPTLEGIPSKYNTFLSYNTVEGRTHVFKEHGTFVLWKNCDRVNPKSVKSLMRRLEFELGRKFRHLIKEGNCTIRIIPIENEQVSIDLMPNDPLMLMKPNYVLGNLESPGIIDPRNNTSCSTQIFEPYTNELCPSGILNIPIKYFRINPTTLEKEISESIVKLTFSIVKDCFYDKTAISGNPGSTSMGKHAKKLEGISIVRANREIDFGKFDFYENLNQPEHRWWGCEISFNPELDEMFGVANNKQQVELHEVDEIDYEDEEIKPIWLVLNPIVSKTINSMYTRNKITRESARTVVDVTTPATNIINSAEEKIPENSNDQPETAEIKNNTPIDLLIEKNKTELKENGIENPTPEEIQVYMNNKVNIVYKKLGRGGQFFEYSFELGACLVEINTQHIFYEKFFEQAIQLQDTKTTFELFIASLVKAIDDTYTTQGTQNDNLVYKWCYKLKEYINEQYNL